MRKKLASKAEGIVLETNVGANRNYSFYNFSNIKKFIGVDWVQAAISKSEQKVNPQMMLVLADMHKMPFSDASFDTVIDTFGLECSYDVNRAYSQIKRLTKPGGKILLLERGLGFWMQDNFTLLRKASVNLGARGQVYHNDFDHIIRNDPEVRVVKSKRKMRGMLYYYELQKL